MKCKFIKWRFFSLPVMTYFFALFSLGLNPIFDLTSFAEESPDNWYQHGVNKINALKNMTPNTKKAKNVILFIGDGMGVSTVTAARILEGQLAGKTGEEHQLAFEKLAYTAVIKTYNVNQQTPDSAGTASAIMTGMKTNAGVIAVNQDATRSECRPDKSLDMQTILEQAELRGYSTGVVTTARLTHATPAATYAHTPEREWETDSLMPDEAKARGCRDIARQLIEFPYGDGLEVALGGGRDMFRPNTKNDPEEPDAKGQRADGRDLTKSWLNQYKNAAYVWNAEQFKKVDPKKVDHLLGLFERSHMRYEYDRKNDKAGEPSLSEMVTTAIGILKKNKTGFFLLVEAGRIDHAHHEGNAFRALRETIELASAVDTARSLVNADDTTILVTADHSHVFTMAGYPTRGNPILGKVRGNDKNGKPLSETAKDELGLPYTTLGYANGPGYTGASSHQGEGSKSHPHYVGDVSGISSGRPNLKYVDTMDATYLQESAIPLAAETHGGEDVLAFAEGPRAYLMRGALEQNVIYHIMRHAYGWD